MVIRLCGAEPQKASVSLVVESSGSIGDGNDEWIKFVEFFRIGKKRNITYALKRISQSLPNPPGIPLTEMHDVGNGYRSNRYQGRRNG
uniref:Uncharacterized protein n=1 Tax=Anopheles atroparvus TaxID=41427 RepID=A0AAG5DID5_ANOAO